MKYVVEERGAAWFRSEVEERLGYALADPSPVHIHDVEDHLGWNQQYDGRWFLGLAIENGRIKDTDTVRLKTGLRQVIEQFRPGLQLTGQQNVLLTDIPAEQRESLEAVLHEYGIPTDPDTAGLYRYAMACPALPTCGLAVAESERILPAVVRQIEAELVTLGLSKERLSVRMTGCPNGCARPFMGDIGLVGRSKDLYNLLIGGDYVNTRLNTLFATAVKTQNVASTLRPLFQLWKDERQEQEGFGDYCHRVGIEYLQAKSRKTSAVSD
jgi:sulfite reductase (ferredoxin)